MRIATAWMLALLLLAGCSRTSSLPFAPPYPRTSSEVRRAMDRALEAGDSEALTRRTLELVWMGGALSDKAFDRIAPHLDLVLLGKMKFGWLPGDGPPVDALRDWFHKNADPEWSRTTKLFAEVPAEYRLVEGIAWDRPSERLFIGTVVDGRLAFRERDGSWHEIPLGFPRASLFGMGVDGTRRLLWIATGSVDQTAVAGPRMAGLIAVDLDRLTVVRRIPLATGSPGAVGDLTVAADGTVYASNVLSGAIHRCRPGCAVLEDLLPPGTFRSPQGLAFIRGARTLYVADYPTGLWTIDTRKPRPVPVKLRTPTMLEGIDALVQLPWNDGLIATQNGTSPRQITTFSEAPNDGGIRSHPRVTIAPNAGEPTLATMKDDWTLLFVGDGQWERYGAGGQLKDGKPARPTPILEVPAVDPIY